MVMKKWRESGRRAERVSSGAWPQARESLQVVCSHIRLACGLETERERTVRRPHLMRVLAPSRKIFVSLGVGTGSEQACLVSGVSRKLLHRVSRSAETFCGQASSSRLTNSSMSNDSSMSLSPRLFDSLARVQSHAHARNSQSERNSLSPFPTRSETSTL